MSFSWKEATGSDEKFLKNLQGNILKGHGRPFTSNIFFQFGDETDARSLVAELARENITSAYAQLHETECYSKTGHSGSPFVHLAISSSGYEALGKSEEMPEDNIFQSGMKDSSNINRVLDPDVDEWEEEFSTDIHAVLLLGIGKKMDLLTDYDREQSLQELDSLTQQMIDKIISYGGQVLKTQEGRSIFNLTKDNQIGNGLEHFGYVDGRSQPLLLKEDIDKENEGNHAPQWDPAFPLSTALVEDKASPVEDSYGSYFIFRKLEQDVRAFKTREQEIATVLNLSGEDRELAGAFIVGRFEDGTPVTSFKDAQNEDNDAAPNDFTYKGSDEDGSKCPFHAHIRKVNPRGTGGFQDEEGERTHIMARRGIPYEDVKRAVHPNDLPEAESFDEFIKEVQPLLPEGDLGLLFMAYNSDIANQFVFSQATWANNNAFPNRPADNDNSGIDPIIGQGDRFPQDQKIPNEWNDIGQGENNNVDFGGFVKMKGGEYFFSPSIPFLTQLSPIA